MQMALKDWCNSRFTAKSVLGGAVITAVLAAGLVSGAMAAGDNVVLQIQDRPLKEVVVLLSKQSGINIILADEASLQKKVTVSLKDVSLDTALDYVVKAAGISYSKMEDGTIIIGGADSAEPVFSADELNAIIPGADPVYTPDFGVSEPITTSKIALTHSKPSEILRLLGWRGENPTVNADVRLPERLRKPQSERQHPQTGAKVISGGNVVSEGTMNAQPVIPTMDPRAMDLGSGRTADISAGAGQVAPPPGYARPGGTGTYGIPGQPYTGGTFMGPGTQGTTNRNNATNAGSNASGTNSDKEQFLWPDGIDNAIPFDLDNSIIVKGTEKGIAEFKNIIRMLDIPPKQVLIKAEFVEVSTQDVKSFGIDWSLNRLNESFSTGFNPTGNVTVGVTSGNLTAALKAELTQTVGRTINSPIVSTINNQYAYISINNIIPFFTSSTYVSDGTAISNSVVDYIEVDTYLEILPRVNGDGSITMMLQPRISDVGNYVVGPDGTSVPEEKYQELYTQRRVANGETMVVGGFIRKTDANSYKKIPLLAELPLIGRIFRTYSKSSEERELLIFVTPTIIPDSTYGTVGSGIVP